MVIPSSVFLFYSGFYSPRSYLLQFCLSQEESPGPFLHLLKPI